MNVMSTSKLNEGLYLYIETYKMQFIKTWES